MIVTEKEALGISCPDVRLVFCSNGSASVSFNRLTSYSEDKASKRMVDSINASQGLKCQASKCMAWDWMNSGCLEAGQKSEDRLGYCGKFREFDAEKEGA